MKKRRMPPHRVLPNGQWRFIKKASRRSSGVATMARRRRSYRRYYGAARRTFRRGRSFGGSSGSVMKNAIDGAIVGVAQTALPDVIPMQDPLIALGVGWFRKNPTLATLGGVQLGAYLGGMVGGTGLLAGKSGVNL